MDGQVIRLPHGRKCQISTRGGMEAPCLQLRGQYEAEWSGTSSDLDHLSVDDFECADARIRKDLITQRENVAHKKALLSGSRVCSKVVGARQGFCFSMEIETGSGDLEAHVEKHVDSQGRIRKISVRCGVKPFCLENGDELSPIEDYDKDVHVMRGKGSVKVGDRIVIEKAAIECEQMRSKVVDVRQMSRGQPQRLRPSIETMIESSDVERQDKDRRTRRTDEDVAASLTRKERMIKLLAEATSKNKMTHAKMADVLSCQGSNSDSSSRTTSTPTPRGQQPRVIMSL